jgi:hypothetical protein
LVCRAHALAGSPAELLENVLFSKWNGRL